MKNWIVTIVIVLVLAGAFALMRFGGSQPVGEGTQIAEVTEADHIEGDINAKAVLVEYGDFQCPACAAYYPLVEQLTEEYGDRMAFVFRHFPLRSIHKNAEIASRSAEAAGLQGKFWEMYDLIYQNQASWANELGTVDIFTSYAESLGLDVEKFKADLTSDVVIDAINKDLREGNSAGINATPTFFFNGELVSGVRSIDDFRQLVEGALAE